MTPRSQSDEFSRGTPPIVYEFDVTETESGIVRVGDLNEVGER